jgi:hypothetical protein
MDATTIQLCLNVFPWATYTQTKGAIKLHFGLNDDGYLPDFMVATTGNVHEINVAKSLDKFKPVKSSCFSQVKVSIRRCRSAKHASCPKDASSSVRVT